MTPPITVAILTVSDRCSRGTATDTSGPALAQLVTERLNATVVSRVCLPDDKFKIADQLVQWARVHPCPDLILTTGGTGLAPRDVTPEATLIAIDRQHHSLLELARARCAEKVPQTFLSRGVAGTIAESLVINLPGSERGSTETLTALLDILPHAVETLRGIVTDDGRGQKILRNQSAEGDVRKADAPNGQPASPA